MHDKMEAIAKTMARVVALAAVFSFQTATPATVALLKDIAADEVIAGSDPWYLGVSGGNAIMAAAIPGESGRSLFRTDGTAGGTVRINVGGIVDPFRFTTHANRVLFFAYTTPGRAETRLWSTDGTDGGTTLVRTLGPGEWSVTRLGGGPGGRFYFCANGGPFNACELYISDGTSAGTVRLANGRSVSASIADAAGNLYFMSNDSSGLNPALWVSDGTAGGTRELHTFASLGLQAIGPMAWVDAQNLYVNGQVPNNIRGLYRIGIASGTVTQLAPNGFSSFAENPVDLNGVRIFLMDDRIWRSDGTPAGTVDLGPALKPFNTHIGLARVGNRVVYVRASPASGTETWVTDGTLAGTQLLVDATPGADGFAGIVAATNDRVFFAAGPGEALRFWVTDGTAANTRVIPQRGGGSYLLQGLGFWVTGAVAGSHVYLQATQLVNLPGGIGPADRLWVTDANGTDVANLGFAGRQLEASGERVFFSNQYDALGNEPWISDGTDAGTTRIRDLAVTGQTDFSNPAVFTRAGTRVFFSAQDRDHGRELWVTDGTSANTRRLTDVNAGSGHSMPLDSRLEASGGLLYFLATPTFGPDDYRLWRSDGTEAGTFALGIGAHALGCGRWTAEYNGRTWFFGHTPPGTLASLWSTDGTAAGTRVEVDLPVEIRNLPLCDLHSTPNGIVFTVGYEFNGASLWRTDGTADGTFRLGTVVPAMVGPGPLTAQYSALAGGFVYLLAGDAAGRELWRTDGTQAGTARVADLTPGPDGAQNFSIETVGTGVVFTYLSAPGTVDGLYRIAAPNAVPERIKAGDVGLRLAVVGSRVFFPFETGGTESLWVTDGSVAGSREVLNPGAGSSLPINQMAAGDNYLYFTGPVDATGEQVWVTNGLVNGTHRVSNFPLNTFFSSEDFVVLGDRAIFSRDDGVHGAEPFIVVNQAPVAAADAATTTRGTSVLVNVRANDTDPDSAATAIALAIVAQPANGTVAVDGTGYRYTPNANFTGTDTFDYQATDELGAQSAVTRVTITVNAPAGGGGGGGGAGTSGGGGGGALGWPLIALLLGAWLVRRRAPSFAGGSPAG